jgi:hypothetical protein
MPTSQDPPVSLIRLRDRREEVIQQLTDHFANDVLTTELFEERIALAHQACTLAALDELVSDLQPLSASAERAVLAPLLPDTSLTRNRPVARVAAIFSNQERKGAWSVPPVLKVSSVFGNTELDFRQARLGPGVTEIRVTVVFGNLEILVPPNLAVECEGTAILASFEHAATGAADPDRPLLRITGRAVFGNVQISTRPPGDRWRERGRQRELPAQKEAAARCEHSRRTARSSRAAATPRWIRIGSRAGRGPGQATARIRVATVERVLLFALCLPVLAVVLVQHELGRGAVR